MPAYRHTQRAPLCLLLYGFALVNLAIALSLRDVAGLWISGGVSLFLLLLAPAFHYLRVEDRGDSLAIQFGPVPLFGRKVSYADMRSVEVGRTLLLDGWGIHYSLRGGWVWNLWGRDCVVVRFRRGGALWIGTDEPQPLAAFLRTKLAH